MESEHRKHHDSHKSEHEKHNHTAKESASSLPAFNMVTVLLLVGMLIVGLIAGAVVSYGTGYTAGIAAGNTNNQTQKVGSNLSDSKVSEVQEKIQSFILANSPEGSIPESVNIVVDYNADAPLGSLGQFLIYFEQGGEKQLAGLAYAGNEAFVFANSFPVDLNSVKKAEPKPPVEVKKSDKPLVELFIWSYCPYGVTALDPFADVAKLLGDSTTFKVNLYYDGHGAFETQQNKTQACIQKYAADKYWDYAKAFASDIYPKCGATEDINCDKTESTALMKTLGISSSKIYSCVDSEGETLISADAARAKALGVTGSPTLTIDGVKSTAARTAEAYKTAVCNSFNTAPADCSSVLSGTAATSSGNCG